MGVRPGMRLVLMVPPSIDFISLVFAMFKAGVITVLIDPGMGRRNLIRCLAESEPEGFIGIPLAQAVRAVLRRRFPKAKYNVTVGRRWFWGGRTLAQLRARTLNAGFQPAATKADDPAAIIFTTGSTGPPKGVLYRHGNFDRQADEIRDFYGIQPGEIDLPGFPLFALFNCAMGVTTVIPDMDPTRPARVDPRNIIEAVRDWNVTQAFGSPALWNVVGRYCEEHQIVLPTLKRVLSAGAPVPPHVLRADEGRDCAGWRRAHALRRDRGAAGRIDCRQRGAGRNGRQERGRRGNLRRPALSRHRVEGDPHHRRADPESIDRGRRTAAGRDRRADRPRARRDDRVRHADRLQPAAQDSATASDVLAPDGRRGLFGRSGAGFQPAKRCD